MAGYINKSGLYRFEDMGLVRVNVRSTARTVRARWRGGELVVSCPTGISYNALTDILKEFAPRLDKGKPTSMYYVGQRLEFEDFSVEIDTQDHAPDKIIATFKDRAGFISIGSNWDIESTDAIKNISKFLCRMAQRIAPEVLIPRARSLSQQVGCQPMMWTISNGHRVLGHCSTQGIIALSYALVFYPSHLRDYVIYHELAHLTEMNHSPRFHEICDSYCEGHEKELVAQLRTYPIPIIR